MIDFMVTEAGVYDGIPNDRYHADPVAAGSLSFSGAKLLLPPSCPVLFRWAQDHPVHKDVFDFGSAAHKLVLGDESAQLVVIDAADFRTKAAQQQRDEARQAGLTPILCDAYQQVEAMADSIRRHPVAAKLFEPGSGKPEQSLFWQDSEFKVWRRGRLDWLPNPGSGRMILCDLKTAVSAEPETWAKAAMNYGYHIQAAHYLDGVKALGLDEDPAFVFCIIEKTPPYVVSIIELDEASLSVGRNLNRIAVHTWKRCRETGHWPAYTSGVEMVSLPEWYLRRFDEA